jgi:hypothetical protein
MYGNMKKPMKQKNQLNKIKKDDIDRMIDSLDRDAAKRAIKGMNRRASPKKY